MGAWPVKKNLPIEVSQRSAQLFKAFLVLSGILSAALEL